MEEAMDKLDEISRRRNQAHTKLQSLKSKVYEAFLHLEEAAFSDGALPKRTKELIAVGISVTSDCESCMQWHIEQAAAAGGTMREVLEAVEVGIEMGGGHCVGSVRAGGDGARVPQGSDVSGRAIGQLPTAQASVVGTRPWTSPPLTIC
jgi:AhpD family alkylhydroperoxidase